MSLSGSHLQLVKIRHQLTSHFVEAAFELIPILASGQIIRLLRGRLDSIDHHKPTRAVLVVPMEVLKWRDKFCGVGA